MARLGIDPGPLTYESGALQAALRDPARMFEVNGHTLKGGGGLCHFYFAPSHSHNEVYISIITSSHAT